MKGRGAEALLVLVGLVVACGGGDDATTSAPGSTTTEAVSAPPYEVEMAEETFTDTTRATPDEPDTGVPAADERVLRTHLYWPVDAAGPQPLIVFAHGADGHPRKFSQIFSAWAQAGYVVAAPAFPLSNDEVPGDSVLTDVREQPDDLRFVLDEVLRLNEEEGSPLEGRIDPEHIGTAGLSLGGVTVYGYVFSDTDERIDAAALFDTALVGIDGAQVDLTTPVPKLFVHADADFTLPYGSTVDAYAESAPPKWFITLHEAAHASPYEDDDDPADEVVTQASIAFWDLTLRDDETGTTRMDEAVAAAPDVASIESDAG